MAFDKNAYKNSWIADKLDRINLTVPKGKKAVIQAHAKANGESVNSFIGRAIDETMARDTENPIPQETPRPEPPHTEQAGQIAELDRQKAEQAEQVTAPRLSNAPRPSNTILRAFTEQDAQQIDYKKLLRDFRYQFEIQDKYGKSVLSDLLTKARALQDPEQGKAPSRTPMEELTAAVMNGMAVKE